MRIIKYITIKSELIRNNMYFLIDIENIIKNVPRLFSI